METITLPDDTEVRISAEDGEIRYEVEGEDTVTYTPDQAREQADSINDREARSWDTVFPEEAGPVLDVADALRRYAKAVERGTDPDAESESE